MYSSLPRPLKKDGKVVMGIYIKVDPEGETTVTRRDCSLSVVATAMHWAVWVGVTCCVSIHILQCRTYRFASYAGADGRNDLA